MSLITVAQLKPRVNIKSADTSQDTLLAGIIAGVGGLLDRYLHRTLLGPAEDEQITETLDGGKFEVALHYWPVADIASVKLATDRDFAVAEVLASDSDYRADSGRGLITRLPSGTRWPDGPGVVQVIYIGGYAAASATASTLPAVPDHIVEAVLLQATDLYQRRSDPGVKAVWNTAGVGSGWAPAVTLLPLVKDLLRDERQSCW